MSIRKCFSVKITLVLPARGTWHNGTLQCLVGELGDASTVLLEHPQTTHRSASVLPVLGEFGNALKILYPVLWEVATECN